VNYGLLFIILGLQMTQSHVSERSLMFHATDNNNVSTLQQHD